MNPLVRALYVAAGAAAEAAASITPAGGGKLRRSLAARRGVSRRFSSWTGRDPRRPLLWMHAPSVGEGLQARPVLAALRAGHPALQLAYTYFSPSATELATRLDVDFRDVLPFDTPSGARTALAALRPDAIVFSKLDVWPLLASEAKSRGVGLGLISATLPAGSSRLRGFAPRLLREAYAALDAVGAISAEDAERLVLLGCRPSSVTVTGDTRFDQVWSRAAAAERAGPLLAPLVSARPTLVAGSTWPADERELLPAITAVRALHPELRVIVAPHEPTSDHLSAVERWATDARIRLARLDTPAAATADVVLVDRVGVLGELYALADIAFVGGAFHGAGIHSVLEPAAYGVPVLFGPRHANSREAAHLIAAGGATAAPDRVSLTAVLRRWLDDTTARRAAGDAARGFVSRNLGATARSVALIESLLSGRRR